MKRSLRIHHESRWKDRVRTYYGMEWDIKNCGRLAAARKTCSSPYCCGNPRRLKGRTRLTRQEQKALLPDGE